MHRNRSVPDLYPGDDVLRALPTQPLRIIVSACLAGAFVIDDGSDRMRNPVILEMMARPNVAAVTFCPEDVAMGTPRETPNCTGGNGFDVLDGRATFECHAGQDHTAAIVAAADAMARLAVAHRADLAILTHISGSCGTSVIYDGHRDRKHYQHGPGVAAAALHRAGIPAISNADCRALRLIMGRLDPTWQAPEDMPTANLWEGDWYQTTFGP